MKPIIAMLCCILFASCSIFRKSVNTIKKETNKSSFSLSDRVDSVTILSTAISKTFGSVILQVDSGYDKVTDELIKDYGDSIFTVRTIKEKGQKRTEQLSHVSKYDSAGSMIVEHSQLQELQAEDSTSTVVAIQKDVKRSSFMPWWLWIVVSIPVAVVLFVWIRNSIKFFT